MADTYDVKLWKNTGFNKGNLPANPSVLASMQYETAPAVFKFQERGLATINLDKTFAEISNVDYVAIGTDYYVVGGITMLSEHTAALALIQDPINSAGGVDSLQVISGWVERAHTRDDTLFANTLPEPFAPTRPLVLDKQSNVNGFERLTPGEGQDNFYYHVVGVTVNLKWSQKMADVYTGEDITTQDTYSVAVPHMEPLESTTDVTVNTPQHIGNYSLPNVKLYLAGETNSNGYQPNQVVSDALATLRSLGIDSAITCSYLLPKKYVTISVNQYPEDPIDSYEIVNISGKKSTHEVVPINTPPSGMSYNSGMSAQNNKVFALWNNYKITSNTSGESIIFEAHDIRGPVVSPGGGPEFHLYSDPSPNGTTYMAPRYFEGEACEYMQQAISGQQWLNEPMALYGASGSATYRAGLLRASRREASELGLGSDTLSAREGIQREVFKTQRAHAYANIGKGAAAMLMGLGAGFGAATPAQIFGQMSPQMQAMGLTDYYTELLPNYMSNYVRDASAQSVSDAISGAKSAASASGGMLSSAVNLMRSWEEQAAYGDWYSAKFGELANSARWSMGDNLFSAITHDVVAPEIICPQTPCFQAYFGNNFTVTHQHMHQSDVTKFDRFLTAYGYADDRKLDHEDFTSRRHFNYVKCSEVELKSAYAPMYIVQMAEQTLINGVRLWHEAPNAAAYASNPMRT